MVLNLQSRLQVWSPINRCIKAGYYSGNFFFFFSPPPLFFFFFSFVFLLIARWKPWALVTEDKLTWEWLSHQSLPLRSFKTVGIETKVLSSKWSLKGGGEEKHLADTIFPWFRLSGLTVVCLELVLLAPFRCSSTTSHPPSKLRVFIHFTPRAYCESPWKVC